MLSLHSMNATMRSDAACLLGFLPLMTFPTGMHALGSKIRDVVLVFIGHFAGQCQPRGRVGLQAAQYFGVERLERLFFSLAKSDVTPSSS